MQRSRHRPLLQFPNSPPRPRTRNPPPVVVSEKYPDPDTRRDPFSTTTINREEISLAPQDQLDDLIKSAVPGFSLFRRSSSEIANPTTQGASLRNIGPNGAGRTLILLDGVP